MANKIEYRGYTIDYSPYNRQYSLHSATYSPLCAFPSEDAVKQYIDKLEESDSKREALHLMAIRDSGAIKTRLGWTWPEDVRNSYDAALAILEVLL